MGVIRGRFIYLFRLVDGRWSSYLPSEARGTGKGASSRVLLSPCQPPSLCRCRNALGLK